MARFRREKPDAHVELQCVTGSEIAAEVLSARLDFAVSAERVSNPSLSSTALATNRMVALMHPRHPWARRRQLLVRDLRAVALMIHTDSRGQQQLWTGVEQPRAARAVMAIPSLDTITRLLELQSGVALLPRGCADVDVSRGTLVAVPLADVEASTLMLVHRDELSLEAQLQSAQQLEFWDSFATALVPGTTHSEIASSQRARVSVRPSDRAARLSASSKLEKRVSRTPASRATSANAARCTLSSARRR